MDSLIFVREYDDSTDNLALQEQAAALPLQLPEGWREGQKWKKSRQSVLAWLLLGQALKEKFGYAFSQLDIRRDEQGKPYSASHPEVWFNISHCSTAYACIVGTAPVGIDVERKFNPKDSLIKRVCHPEEYERLAQMEEETRVRQFRYLWSLKEAWVKMDGRGLGYGLERANFAMFLPIRAESERAVLEMPGTTELTVCDCGDYTLAACEARGNI